MVPRLIVFFPCLWAMKCRLVATSLSAMQFTPTLTPKRFELDGFKTHVNKPRFGLGMRLNLAIFKLFASYTIQEYNTFSTGSSVSIR
ncbi:MAG: DUF6588 family protein [Flavobacteriaceae bacterium]